MFAASSVAAASAVPQAVRALTVLQQNQDQDRSKIEVGYAAITWGDHLMQALADISALGYRGIQLRANAVSLYPDPLVFKAALAEHKLNFTALSSGDLSLDSSQESDNLNLHGAHAAYLSKGGGQFLQILGTFRSNGQYTAEEYVRTGRMLTEVGKRAVDQGVQIGFHNHMGSIAQSPEQLARILDAADPRYVKLLLDVAHYKQGGGNPVDAVRHYADRLLYVHFKDVKAAGNATGYEFVELGQGTVDLPAVVEALRGIRFRGWAVVELDQVPVGSGRTPKQCAALSKSYMNRVLGIEV